MNFPRNALPPMSAEWWRSVDEQTFRDIVASNMDVLCSPTAYDAIRERCVALGIDIDAEKRRKHFGQYLRGVSRLSRVLPIAGDSL